MNSLKDKFIDSLPLLAFLLYWLTAGLLSAFGTGEPRLTRLWFVTLPVLVFMGAGLYKVFFCGRK